MGDEEVVDTWVGGGNNKPLIVEEMPNAQHRAAWVSNTDEVQASNLGSENVWVF